MPGVSASPDVAVLVNGNQLSSQAYADLVEVSVQQDTEALSACTLQLSAWDDKKVDLAWVDSDTFAIGGELEVKLGRVDALKSVFQGEITGVELEFVEEEAPRFIVRGYDRRHRLLRGTRVRSFTKMKDSDIADRIARDHGLSSDVVDSKVKHDYVLQDGRSDLDFLRARAAPIGYEVLVDGKTLRFRPIQTKAGADVTLKAGSDLTSFSARLTSRHQVGKVEVRGWDPSAKQAVVGVAASGQESSMGSKGGPSEMDKAFSKATLNLVDRAVTGQDEADRIALGVLERLALAFVHAEGTCPGRADLRAGAVVDVQGVGKRFSGKYVLTSVTHGYSSRDGFTTSFVGRRNAI